MPKELSPSDRMQLRGRGDLMHPGSCIVCGNGNCEEGYVDIGVYLDYGVTDGQVYLCMVCATEVAETAGMLSKAESDHLMKIADKVAATNADLTNQLEVANERLQHYDALFNASFADITSDLKSPGNNADEKSKPVRKTVSEPANGGKVEQPESVESGPRDGPTEPSRIKRSDIEF